MGANIITGYTGTRHITPAMDAAVFRSIFGQYSYVLSDGNKLAGSMPSINEFTILDGVISMQGHQIQVTQESLSVDTCANGYERIDLIVCRYEHDNNSLIDSTELLVLKGTEVQSGNTPTAPAYNQGVIDQGATVVDMPLYQLRLSGASVTITRLFLRQYTVEEARPFKVNLGSISSLPVTFQNSKIVAEHEVPPGNAYLSNPTAQTGDWTITTNDGSLTLSGAISGSTSVTLWLEIPTELISGE